MFQVQTDSLITTVKEKLCAIFAINYSSDQRESKEGLKMCIATVTLTYGLIKLERNTAGLFGMPEFLAKVFFQDWQSRGFDQLGIMAGKEIDTDKMISLYLS